MRRAAASLLLLAATLAHAQESPAEPRLLPSPFPLLRPRALTPGFLDAAPACIPGAERPSFANLVERARRGDLVGARQALGALPASDELRADAELARAIVDARGAALARTLAARGELDDALRETPESSGRACARLELARLSLRLRMAPEAAVEVGRAERAAGASGLTGSLRETAAYYRAESLVLASRREEAREAFESIYGVLDPSLDLAIRLRRADLRAAYPVPSAGPEAGAVFREMSALLTQARDRDLDVTGWAPRAAEFAIAGRDFPSAHRWLAEAERIEGLSGIASIRKADVLSAMGRPADAHAVLERVSGAASYVPARHLARVRLAALGLSSDDEERIATLRRATGSPHPKVVAQAHDALADALLDQGEIEASLEALARAAHSGLSPLTTPLFPETLEAVLARASAVEFDCAAVIWRLGGRRALFLRHARAPGPFVRLAGCFRAFGMPELALDVYRGITRRFGADRALDLALPMAGISLELGEVASLRAVLAAYGAQRGATRDGEPEWEWLQAQLAFLEDDPTGAAERLEALAFRSDLAPELRAQVERALARLDEGVLERGRVTRALVASLAQPSGAAARDEAWLRVADALRAEGRREAARSAYRRAAKELPAGARRSRALYVAALLEGSAAPLRTALDRAGEEQGAWSRLARAERRLAALRAAVTKSELPEP